MISIMKPQMGPRLMVHADDDRVNFEGRGELVGILEAPRSSRVRREDGVTILDIMDCNDMDAPFAFANAIDGNADLQFFIAPGVDRQWVRYLANRP